MKKSSISIDEYAVDREVYTDLLSLYPSLSLQPRKIDSVDHATRVGTLLYVHLISCGSHTVLLSDLSLVVGQDLTAIVSWN